MDLLLLTCFTSAFIYNNTIKQNKTEHGDKYASLAGILCYHIYRDFTMET